MYLGMVIFLVGVATMFGTITPILIIPVFIWVIAARFIVHEEKALEKQFAQEYIDYCKSVRRWF